MEPSFGKVSLWKREATGAVKRVGLRAPHLSRTLPQISTLLFATLYILCHIALTHFKKPAEFTTGTCDFPPFCLPSASVPVAMAPASREEAYGACWERRGGSSRASASSASPAPQAETRW